ncbi:MAG: transglutaminase N-terminal domain-containing protein, partial [Planctomycetota bacterium]
MSQQVALHHRTTYQYEKPISLGPQTIRLRPAVHCRTPILSYSLQIQPQDHFLNWQQDPHGNFLARAVFPKPTRQLTIDVDLIASLVIINPFDFFLEPEAVRYPFTYASEIQNDLQPYLQLAPASAEMRAFVQSAPRKQTGTVDFLVDLNRYVHDRVQYLIRLEPGVQSCEQTLRLGSGSCRDSAWLLVQTLRHLGLAARFVSGYLIQLKPDTKPLAGPSGATEDFTDLHAWTEVYLPGAGWIGLDPTSGLLAAEGHLPLAATPDPTSAAPLTGAVEPSKVQFDFSMHLQRVQETPRVT